MRPVVLTIAGSDSSGGAGIQADIKAIEANGGYGATVVTAVTAQNTRGVRRWEGVAPELVREQVEAVFEDLPVAAVKSGMLASAAIVKTVAACLIARRPRHYVLDPVVWAKSGHALMPEEGIARLLDELVPLCSLLTPNAEEAGALAGFEVADLEQAKRAGRRLLEWGAGAVLVKGGHLSHPDAVDLLVTREGSREFRSHRIDTPHTHGTGCVLSAAIATQLALGLMLAEAVAQAKGFVTQAIRHGLPLGGGRGPTDPLFALHAETDAMTATLRVDRA